MAVRTGIDTARLSAAVSRPGIDPRRWLAQGTVLDLGYDAEHGMFADVQVLPDKDVVTCRLGAAYAGSGYGEWRPPPIGAVVIVGWPDGEPDNGGIVFMTLWTAAMPPPAEFAGDTPVPAETAADPVTRVQDARTFKIVAKNGAAVRIEVEGDGNVEIVSTGNAQVQVSSESAVIINSRNVLLGDSPGANVSRVGDLVVGATPPMMAGPFPVLPVGAAPTATGGVPVIGQITSGASTVKAGS